MGCFRKDLRIAFFAGLTLSLLFSCENPFEKGLGDKVNITPPVIQITSPVPGNYIQDITRMEGTATDDRGVTRIEIGVFDTIEDEAPRQWSGEGVMYDGSKNWYYDFDTSSWNGGKDGTIKLQFRVFDDGADPVTTAPLVYVIKNSPPELTVTTPAPGANILITGTTIRGQVRDRRGIKPGYPMIKFWEEGTPEPDDNAWVSVEIPGVDRNDLASLGTARRTSEFTYTLKKTDDSKPADGQHYYNPAADLDLGSYRFRFKTRDYVVETDAEDNTVNRPELEKERFNPPEGEDPYTITLVSSTESVRFDLAPPVNPLPPAPHQYIEAATSYKKAAPAGPSIDLFTLRVEVSHSHGIEMTAPDRRPEIRWRHDTGTTAWAPVPSALFTVVQKDGTNPLSAWILTYTAKSGDIALPSHSVPYVFEIRVWSADGNPDPTIKEYTVYMAGAANLTVSFQSVKGAASEPSVSDPSYTVNQTFEVQEISSPGGDAGMRTVLWNSGGTEIQQPVLRWRLVQDGSQEHTSLENYRASPPRYNTSATDEVGSILPAASAAAEYISSGSFTVNTSGKTGTYWLYILAQDQAYNVGFLRQKINVDQAADYPEIKINRTFALVSKKDSAETGWPPVNFAAVEGNAGFPGWKTNNIFRQGQSFDITLNDDDGLDISNLKIYISDELAFGGIDNNGNPTGSPEGTFARREISAASIQDIFPGSSPLRQVTGTITQELIAGALGKAALPDGVYRFDMEVKDRAADKVNTAEDVRTTLLSFWFACSAGGMDFPDNDISPKNGTFVTAAPVPVTGIVKSRLQVAGMTGTGPDGAAVSFASGDFTLSSQPPAVEADGYYTYTWKHPVNVDFTGGAGNAKTYTLTAADRFGKVSTKTLTLTLDNIRPVINLMPFETLAGNKVNGEIEFTFTVEEANGVKEIRWWLSESDTTPPSWETGFNADGSLMQDPVSGYLKIGAIGEGGNYTVTVDTSTITIPQNYYLYAVALDQAGNLSAAVPAPLLDMNIDQDSDAPGVTTVDPPEETAVRFWGTDADPLKITGTVTDDDGFPSASGNGGAIDPAKKYVEIRFPESWDAYGAPTSWGGDNDNWITVPGTIDAEGASSISFDFNVKEYYDTHKGDTPPPKAVEYLDADGRKEFQIRVTDEPARKGGVAGAASKSSVKDNCYFILDNAPPEYMLPDTGLVFKTAADAEAALQGLALIEMNLRTAYGGRFEYNFYGDWEPLSFTEAPDEPGKYTWSIPADALDGFDSRPDGEVIVQFRARDEAGSEIPKEWLFYKDTQGPEASFSTISRARTAVTIPAPGDFPANWPLDWPFGGKWQSDSAWTSTWKTAIANWPSEYAFMSPADIIASLTADKAAVPTVVSGSSPVIQGNFWDRYSYIRDNASDAAEFWYRFNNGDRADGTGWITGALNGGDADTGAPAAGQSTVFWTIPLTDSALLPDDGAHTFDIKVADKRGNVTELYGLAFKVDRYKPVVAITEPSVFSGNPDHIIGIGGAGGDTNPVITLTGTASDALLKKVTVRLFKPDGTVLRFRDDYTVSGNSANWSFDITGDDLYQLGGTDETIQRIAVSAEDEAGQEADVNNTWYFYKDTKAPVISYTNLGKGADGLSSGNSFDDTSLVLKGAVEDYNKVQEIKYYIAKWSHSAQAWMNWNPAGAGNWDAAYTEPAPSGSEWPSITLPSGGSKTVNWELDLAADPRLYQSNTGVEGQYRIKIYARDYSYHTATPGNPIVTSNTDSAYSDAGMVPGDPANPPSPRVFFIDKTSPVITWSAATAARQYYRNETIDSVDNRVEFTGSAVDLNSILRIRARFDDVNFTGTADQAAWPSWVNGDNNWTPGTGGRNWRLVMDIPTGTANQNRIYTLNIEVTDAAGKVNYFNKEFTLDNTPPSIKVNQPQSSNAIVAGEVNVRGEGLDGFGSLSAVRYWLGGDSAPVDPAEWKTGIFTVENPTSPGQSVDLAEFDGGALVWNLRLDDSTNFSLAWANIESLVSKDTTTGLEGYVFKGEPIPADKTIYRLPVRIGALDAAGNFAEYDADAGLTGIQPLTLLVYPEGDRPTVTITNPDPAGDEASRLVGGEVRVFGEALDNAWIKQVYFRVLDTDNSPINSLVVPNWNSDGTAGSGTQSPVSLSASDVDYTGSPAPSNQGGWYLASGVESSRMNWYVNINSQSELDPPAAGERRPVTIEVVAFDAFRNSGGSWGGGNARISGPITRVSASFVRDAPKFSGERVFAGSSPSWNEGAAIPISEGAMLGAASYKVIIRDEGGVNSLRWRKTSTGPWSELTTVDKTAYETDLAANLAAAANRGIVARAEPRNVIDAGSIQSDTWYMVIETGDTNWTDLSTAGTTLPNDADYTKYTTFKTQGSISPSGTGKVIKAVQIDGTAITADTQNRYYEWEITVDLDTQHLQYYDQPTDSWLGYSGKARNHFIYLQAQDITKPNASVTNRTVSLPIDYFYPQAIYTGNAGAAGGNYSVQGTATDNGSGVQVQGIRKVILWFNKDMVITGNTVTVPGTNYNFKTGASFTMPTTQPFTAVMGRTSENLPSSADWNSKLLTYYLPGDDGATSIVIDKDDPLGASGHHIPMGFSGTGDGKEWYAEIDTTKLPGGPITLNYVVFDYAGNASFYQQRLIIKNSAPQINQITLGTDLLGNQGSVATWAGLDPAGKAKPLTVRSGAGNTYTPKVDDADTIDFMARNSLLFFNVEMTGVTSASRTFQLDYVSGGTAVEADSLVRGSIYRITDVGTGTNWEAVGAPAGYKAGSVFLAAVSGTPYGTGKAELLNTVPALRKTWSGTSNNQIQALHYASAAFGTGAGLINDSPQEGYAGFILKVFDGSEADDFADIALINIKVQNADASLAEGRLYDLNPLTMELQGGAVPTDFSPAGIGENRTAPGLWYTSTDGRPASRSGHIEPRKTTTLTSAEMGGAANAAAGTVSRPYADPATFFTVDTVSGRVILRGYAENDQRLGNISLTIGGTGFTILEKTAAVGTPPAGKTGLLVAAGNANASGKVFFTDVIDLKSHRVEWAYLWDTETLPAAAVGSVDVKVTVYNNAATPVANTDRPQASSNASYTSVTVNTAPYITGLSRAAQYNSARSTQGWYAFSRGETITLTGFNLKHSTGATAVSLPGAASITSTAALHTVSFTVPAAAASGVLGLTANGVKAVNTNTGAGYRPAAYYVNPWNKDSSAAVEGSGLWEDFTSVHVWQSDDTAGTNANRGLLAKPATGYLLSDPSMTINPANGQLHGLYSTAWQSTDNTNRVVAASNAVNSVTNLFGYVDPVVEGGIQYANGGVYAIYNMTGNYDGGTTWNRMGGIYIKGAGGTDTGMDGDANGGSHYLVEKAALNQLGDQFANPHLAVYSSGTGNENQHLHASYYDTKDGSIKYRYNQGNSPGTISSDQAGAAGNRRWINLDGGQDTHDQNGYGSANSRVRAATEALPRSTNAGRYNAIDVTSNGHPVIAYFDEASQVLKLAYCSNTGSDYLANTWTVMEVLGAADPNRLETGSYVTMRIDRDSAGANAIHIAAYNTAKSALVYVKGTWNAGATGAPSFGGSLIVDTGAGGRADISLDSNGNPWITYADNNEAEGYGKLKLAYFDSAAFTRELKDLNGRSIKGWEALNIPIRYEAKDDRLNVENFPVRGIATTGAQFWNAAVGYLTKDQQNFRIAYRAK